MTTHNKLIVIYCEFSSLKIVLKLVDKPARLTT